MEYISNLEVPVVQTHHRHYIDFNRSIGFFRSLKLAIYRKITLNLSAYNDTCALKTFVSVFPYRFGYQQPIYINMVRDPIMRLISSYYYRLPKKQPTRTRLVRLIDSYNVNVWRYSLVGNFPVNRVSNFAIRATLIF